MKKIITLLLVVLIFSACKIAVNNDENDPSKKIASIKTEIYTIVNEEINQPKLVGYNVLTFNEKGLEETKMNYAKDSSLILKDVYTYFKEKNLVKIETSTEDHQIVSTEVDYYVKDFKYIKERIRYNQFNELMLKDDFIWENDHQKVAQTRTINEELFFNSVSTFNELNNLVFQKVENKKDNYVSTYEYKYVKFDDQQKWLERQEFLDSKLVKIEKREILYQ
tara:strand:- start:7269 stop:7934 length:666 start_codon:yes stop_codon:yes gene_type:complete